MAKVASFNAIQCVRAPKGMCSHGTWFALLAAEFLGSKIKMVAVCCCQYQKAAAKVSPANFHYVLVQPNDTERLKLTQRNFAQGP